MPAVHRIFLLEIAAFTVAVDKVAQRAAAGFNRTLQHGLDHFHQGGAFFFLDLVRRAVWQDARSEQAFVRIDIAHADHDGIVHQGQFDCSFLRLEFLVKIVGGEIV